MDKQKQLYKDNEDALTQIAQEGVAARIAIDEAYQDAKRSSCPSKTFLDEHKGVIPFLWTNPHGQTKKYVCENYEISQKKGNFWQIGLKFEQVF